MTQILSGVSMRDSLLQPVFPPHEGGGNTLLSTVSIKRNQLLVRYRKYGVPDNEIIGGLNVKPVEHIADNRFIFVQL